MSVERGQFNRSFTALHRDSNNASRSWLNSNDSVEMSKNWLRSEVVITSLIMTDVDGCKCDVSDRYLVASGAAGALCDVCRARSASVIQPCDVILLTRRSLRCLYHITVRQTECRTVASSGLPLHSWTPVGFIYTDRTSVRVTEFSDFTSSFLLHWNYQIFAAHNWKVGQKSAGFTMVAARFSQERRPF